MACDLSRINGEGKGKRAGRGGSNSSKREDVAVDKVVLNIGFGMLTTLEVQSGGNRLCGVELLTKPLTRYFENQHDIIQMTPSEGRGRTHIHQD